MMNIAIAFSQYGPYHHARVKALSKAAPDLKVFSVQIAANSKTYAWNVERSEGGIVTLCSGAEEDASFISVFSAALKFWRKEEIVTAFLPSYSPASSLALLISARLCGVKCIMMNESHAGTERAKGFKRIIKKWLISLFHGAIVGGEPHRRYFESLGLSGDNIVTGYDAIDNTYFSEAATKARLEADRIRKELALPERYLLSLGRLVEKKNLTTLVGAFAAFRREQPDSDLKLVFVGSGACQAELVSGCEQLGFCYTLDPAKDDGSADVFFYGFRQIDENPAFYALAEAFVLPSIYEEWGLVVNEAMACGLPILVSRTVGSAEDLVVPGLNGYHFDPTSVQELTTCIRNMDADLDSRRRMGEASLRRIQDWGCENFAKNAQLILERVTS
jgi:1,2-diacylglycerol 3-alpha-glucosyltransferase